MNHLSRNMTIVLAVAVAGCNSGGSTPSVSTPVVSNSSTATPPPTATQGFANMTVTGPARLPASTGATVSTATSIVAFINSVNGSSTLPSGVNPTTQVGVNNGTGGNCTLTNNVESCVFQLPAPSGTVNATITLYAGSSAIATTTTNFTSTGSAAETQSASLGGIVTSVTVGTPQLTLGTSSTNPLTLTAIDPSGAVISGSIPFANSIILTDNDTSAATQLELGGSSTASTTLVDPAPSSVVNLIYNGNAYQPFTVTAVAGQATVAQPISATAAKISVYQGR